MLISFSQLNGSTCCMRSAVFFFALSTSSDFFPQGLLTQEFLGTCPDFSLLTGMQHHGELVTLHVLSNRLL